MNNRNNLIFIVLLLIFPSLLYADSSEEATKLVVRFGNYLNSWSRNPGDIEARDGLKLICNNGQNMRVADRLALEKCTTTDDNTILLGSYLRIFEDRHNEKIDYIIYNPKVEKVATKYATDNTNIISVVADVEVKSASLNYMMKNVFYIKDNKICFIGDYAKETAKTSKEILKTQSSTSKDSSQKYPERLTFTVKGVSFDMIYVEGGIFMLGVSPWQHPDFHMHKPAFPIKLSGYYISETVVTEDLRGVVVDEDYSVKKRRAKEQYPAAFSSERPIQYFIDALNYLTHKKFSLPTDAQWEYAARGGNKSKNFKYSGSNNIDSVGWPLYSNRERNHRYFPVKKKCPNELGIYDMTGNIVELCHYCDYTRDTIQAQIDPPISLNGFIYSFRGYPKTVDAVSTSTDLRTSTIGYCTSGYPAVGLRLVLIP